MIFQEDLINFHCPRYNELPNIDLYMEQVIKYIDDNLKTLYCYDDEKVLTSAMVNNYVKQKIVEAPNKKHYTKDHLAYLILVCILKKVISLPEICKLLNMQIESYPLPEAYDYCVTELENALKFTFDQENYIMPNIATQKTIETKAVRSAVLSCANKIFLQHLLKNLEKDHK